MPELFAFAALDAGFGAEAAGLGAAEAGFGAADAGLGAAEAGFSAADAGFGAADAGFGSADAGLGAAEAGIGSVTDTGLGTVADTSFGAATPESGLGGSLDTGLGAGPGTTEFGGDVLQPGIQSLPGIGQPVGAQLAAEGLGGETVAAQIGADVGQTGVIGGENFFEGPAGIANTPGVLNPATLAEVDPAAIAQLQTGFTTQDYLAGLALQQEVPNFQIPGFNQAFVGELNQVPGASAAAVNDLAAAGQAELIGAGIEQFPTAAATTSDLAAPGIAVDSSGLGASLGFTDTMPEIAAAAEGVGPLPANVFGGDFGLPGASSLTGTAPSGVGIGATPVGGLVSPDVALSASGTGQISDIAAGDALGGGNAPLDSGGGPASISPAVPGETTLEGGFSNFSQTEAANAPVTNPAITNPNPFTDVGSFQPPQQIDSTLQGSSLNGPPANNTLNFGQGGLNQPAPITPATPGSPFAPGVTPDVPDIIQPQANTFQQLDTPTDTLETEEQPRGAGSFATPDLLGSAPIAPPDVGSPFGEDLAQQQFISKTPVENFGFADILNANPPASFDPNIPGGFGSDLSEPDFGLGPSTSGSNLGIASNSGIFPSGTDSFGFSGATDVASTPDLFGDIETGPQTQLGGAYNPGFQLQAGDVTWGQPGSAVEQGLAPVSSQNIGPFATDTTVSPAGVGAPPSLTGAPAEDAASFGKASPTLSGNATSALGGSDFLGNLLPKSLNLGQLAGLGVAGYTLANRPKVPAGTNAAEANANALAASGQTLVNQTAPTAIQQAAIDKVQQDAMNQLRQQYFSQGRDPNADSSFPQQAADLAARTAALAAAFVQQANQLGAQEVGSADATLTAVGQTQLAVQTAFNTALLNVGLSLARLFTPTTALNLKVA